MDMDVGEMFPNFPLHVAARAFCGVNLTRFDDLNFKYSEKIIDGLEPGWDLTPSHI